MRSELIEARTRSHLLAKATVILRDAINLDYEEPADHRYYKQVSGSGTVQINSEDKDLTQTDYATLRGMAYKMYYANPYARSILRTLVKFVFGKGVELDIKADETTYLRELPDPDELAVVREGDQQLIDEVQAYLKLFYNQNKWSAKQKEMALRAFRDGEAFIFIRDMGSEADTPEIYFIEPDLIRAKEPTNITHGIETDPDNVEKVISYRLTHSINGIETEEIIPPEKIVHIKLNVDANVKRGRSVLEPILGKIKMYDEWLKNRMVLNRVRSAVALIKQIEGTPAQVKQIRDGNQAMAINGGRGTGSTASLLSTDNRQQALRPGTVFTAGPGVTYQMLSPNLGASDAAQDGRTLLSTIAAGVGFPEMFLSGDFSNSNMASSYVAQNPLVREFEDYQDTFDMHLQDIIRRVIKIGIANNKLTAKAEDLLVSVIWPPLIHRDIPTLTAALEKQHQNRVISRRTFCTETGHDYEEEKRRIQEEDEEEPPEDELFDPFGQGGFGGQANAQSQPILHSEFSEDFKGKRGRPGLRGGSLPRHASSIRLPKPRKSVKKGLSTIAGYSNTRLGDLAEPIVAKFRGNLPFVGKVKSSTWFGAKDPVTGQRDRNKPFDVMYNNKFLVEVKVITTSNKKQEIRPRPEALARKVKEAKSLKVPWQSRVITALVHLDNLTGKANVYFRQGIANYTVRSFQHQGKLAKGSVPIIPVGDI